MDQNQASRLQQSFSEFENFLQNEQLSNQMPTKVQEKLKFLQDSFNNPDQEINPQNYPHLHQDELNQLQQLPIQAKIDLYLNIVNCLISKNILMGQIDILGSMFWNERQIELHQNEKKLKIFKKKKSNQAHEIDLNNYILKWIGFKKDKHCLQLTQVQGGKSKFKEILIGSNNLNHIEDWYGNFQQCCKEYQTEKTPKRKVNGNQERRKNNLEIEDRKFNLEIEEQKGNIEYYNLSVSENQPSCYQLPHLLQSLKDKLNLKYLRDDSDFELFDYQKSCRILQHKVDPYHFKLYQVLPKLQDEKLILYALFDHYQQKKWNQEIQEQQIQLISNNNTILLKRKMKPYGQFYKDRTFEVMRHIHLLKNKKQVFIIEKSTNKSQSQIDWSITYILNKRILVCDTHIRNGGYLTQQQDVNVTLKYLQQYSSFAAYLKELKYTEEEFCIPNLIEEIFIERDNQIEDEDHQEEKEINFQQREQQSMDEKLKMVDECKHWVKAICQYNQKIRSKYNDKLQEKDDQGNHFFYKDEWVTDEKKGVLKFVHKQKLDIQKHVFTFILKKIGSNLLAGRSILNISLPVSIFDKRSNLERLACSFCYAPIFLEKAAQQSNPVKRLQYSFLFGISMGILYLTLEKPFNPILGETFQTFIKGCPVYLEQISHHPPIAAFQFFGRGYKFEGNLEVQANIRPNTVVGRNKGLITVSFDNNKIQMNQFTGIINGITFGDRIFYLDGQMLMVDIDNKLVLDIQFNPNNNGFFSKKVNTIDFLEGKIYQVDEQEIERYKRLGIEKYDGIKNEQRYKKVSLINGRWPQQVYADENEIFNIFKDFPFYLEQDNQVLASDSRYREDLIAWKTNNFDLAMEKKVIKLNEYKFQQEKLENIQRNDRKLRARLGPNSKK